MLTTRDPALKLIMKLRDEAHRFAISYHKFLRRKGETKYRLKDFVSKIESKGKGWKLIHDPLNNPIDLDVFASVNTDYTIQCPNGHISKRRGQRLLVDVSCPDCPNENLYKHSLKELQEEAEKNEGECLSTDYFGLTYSYRFKCKNNHIFTFTGRYILIKKKWCKKC